jgi:hypothetical protein
MTSDTDSFGCHGVQRIPLTSLCPTALTAPLQLADAMGRTPVSNPAACLRTAFWASRTTDAPLPGPGALSAGGSPILGAKSGTRSAKKSLGKVCRSGQADMRGRCDPDPCRPTYATGSSAQYLPGPESPPPQRSRFRGRRARHLVIGRFYRHHGSAAITFAPPPVSGARERLPSGERREARPAPCEPRVP